MSPPSFRAHVSARLKCCAVAWAMCCGAVAEAGISLGSTRLVIAAPQGEGTVEVRNEGTTPVLLQVWLDRGDPQVAPEDLQVPLIVEHPVLRLEPGRQQSLRLHFTGRPEPPQERESLYWLNVQEVPVQASSAAVPRLQVAFRTRIKVMYRPLAVMAGANRAWEGLRFSLAETAGETLLRIFNPARVHVTLLSLATPQGPLPVPAEGLLLPGGLLELLLSAAQAEALSQGALLSFQCIDDAGNLVGTTRRPDLASFR